MIISLYNAYILGRDGNAEKNEKGTDNLGKHPAMLFTVFHNGLFSRRKRLAGEGYAVEDSRDNNIPVFIGGRRHNADFRHNQRRADGKAQQGAFEPEPHVYGELYLLRRIDKLYGQGFQTAQKISGGLYRLPVLQTSGEQKRIRRISEQPAVSALTAIGKNRGFSAVLFLYLLTFLD